MFSDGDEVNYYLTDPLDANSVPELDLIGFNTGVIPSTFLSSDTSNADWYIDDGALRSGDIDDSEVSSIIYSKTFSVGTLSFDALVSSESCCDKLKVSLDDDQQVIYIREQETVSHSFALTAGEHSITFSYVKDSSASTGDDAAWIDNILFTPSS